MTIASLLNVARAQQSARADVDEHLHHIAQELPPDSSLRHEILAGGRGSGVHYAWMNEMEMMGIKRVIVWIDIAFDNDGRPKTTTLSRTEYFSQYDRGAPISDSGKLKTILDSDVVTQIEKVALERAVRGHWMDLPRPTPRPFVGGVKVELFDDEWLPTPPPIYFIRAPGHSDGR